MKSGVSRCLPVVIALCLVPAHAGTISYSVSGTFTPSTPSSSFTGPSEAWAFAFQADTHPTPVSDVGNGGFDFPFSSFSYFLNSMPAAITPTFIRFFSGPNGGGFEVCFNGATRATCTDGLATFGPQMYSGTTSAPTLSPGAFTSDSFGVVVNSANYDQPNTTVQATVPEPSTLLTLAAGLLALVGRRLYRRG
jgi:hypothetical protein